MSSNLSGRAAEQAAIYQQKRIISDQVRTRFARFGDDVLSIVLGYALQPKRMPLLLQKVSLKAPPELDAQLSALWNFVAESGARDFVSRVRARHREEVKGIELTDEGMEDLVEGGVETQPAPSAPKAQEKGSSTNTKKADPNAKAVSSPQYKGPERRSGNDRRAGQDRRGGISAIRKNKRYGGDRRKNPRGRRKSDLVK